MIITLFVPIKLFLKLAITSLVERNRTIDFIRMTLKHNIKTGYDVLNNKINPQQTYLSSKLVDAITKREIIEKKWEPISTGSRHYRAIEIISDTI